MVVLVSHTSQRVVETPDVYEEETRLVAARQIELTLAPRTARKPSSPQPPPPWQSGDVINCSQVASTLENRREGLYDIA